jgi:Xaa-Pro aminopeptidase
MSGRPTTPVNRRQPAMPNCGPRKRPAHDGGTVLAPRWDRYGAAPFGVVEERNVFTLEYGTAVPGRGYIGLEEDVLVTADGIEWLSTPQRELWLVR